MSADSSDNPMLESRSKSQMYRDYERAFTQGTGLPLSLHKPEMMHVIKHAHKQENPFCALLAKSNQSCAQCYELQCKLEQEAKLEPKTLKCFAGLCETAVPVRVGDKLIAFLGTGQILVHRPDKIKFKKIAALLIKWGSEVDLKRLEEAYYNTRVLAPKQYESLIRLLTIFAEHLASCSNLLELKGGASESAEIKHARSHIRDHPDDEMSLETVAHIVNMSANYFSEKFKEATGFRFVEYVTRSRVEKARILLNNPNLRVSEIAFQVGFHSLSQFNRAFKKVVGKSPSEYREFLSLNS